MRKILVCGGLDYCDKKLFYETLDRIVTKEDTIVSGHASGADTLAEMYAEEKGIKIEVFPPEWKKYGKAAGPIRNKQMLECVKEFNPIVIAFWNGQSRGTKNTVLTARKMGIEPIIITY